MNAMQNLVTMVAGALIVRACLGWIAAALIAIGLVLLASAVALIAATIAQASP